MRFDCDIATCVRVELRVRLDAYRFLRRQFSGMNVIEPFLI
jgi:hypothetical protein